MKDSEIGTHQSRAVCNRTRHLLGENLLAPCFGQCVALQGKVLVDGRNASIADQHRFDVMWPPSDGLDRARATFGATGRRRLARAAV
jgi:hypothetical protein